MQMKNLKKTMAVVLSLATVLTSMQLPTLQASAEEDYEATPISSLEYVFEVSNVTDETEFTFSLTTSSWENLDRTVELNGDGYYSVKVSPTWGSTCDGMNNLGYVQKVEGSSMVISVENLIVNDTYTLEYQFDKNLYAGTDYNNGLKNIWSGLADSEVIFEADDAKIAFDATSGTIKFYTKSNREDSVITSEKKTISSLAYDFEITGIKEEEELEFTLQGTDWGNVTEKLALNGDGNYTLTVDAGKDGLTNLGFFTTIPDSEITATLTGLTINGEYVLNVLEQKALYIGTDWGNGLYNIWNGHPADTVYASCEGAELKYDGSAIAFYVTKTMKSTGMKTSRSQDYINAMGQGWNLGNSFDGYDPSLSPWMGGETAWGNVPVTKELIHAVKEKGYDTIRMPMTVYGRYTENADSQTGFSYVIDEAWLARYKEVVDMAVAENLHVMVNIHHDSWIWLSAWDGNQESKEYRMFTDFWKQIAAYFADESDFVCFETINEPTFQPTGKISAQDKLDMINFAAYDAIRNTPGNETRMIVLPTMSTNDEQGKPLYNLICELGDENIIATVHYYSAWVFSANLGITGFDEKLWDQAGYDCYSSRVAADEAFERVYKQFTEHGIGVVVGEYGVLGYDAGEQCNELGEELKYYEYVNELSRKKNLCMIFWDNGSGIDRTSSDYSWKKPLVGEMLEACNAGQRSSYATGLDTLYFSDKVNDAVSVSITLNGNTFAGIDGLTLGVDYNYDEENAVILLSKDFVNTKYDQCSTTGIFADLVVRFSDGASWHEYLVKYSSPVYNSAEGTTDSFTIPVDFNGTKVRRVTAYAGDNISGMRIGPNSSWWAYLQYDGCYTSNAKEGYIRFYDSFFKDETVASVEGNITVAVEYYDGHTDLLTFTKNGSSVTYMGTEKEEKKNGSYLEENGYRLYADGEQITAEGVYQIENAAYYVNANGMVETNIKWIGKKYLNSVLPQEGYYHMHVNGEIMLDTGIVRYESGLDENGEVIYSEKSYYLVNGLVQKNVGLIKINDAFYYVSYDGSAYANRFYAITKTNGLCMEQNDSRIELTAGKYYFDESGKMHIAIGTENFLVNDTMYLLNNGSLLENKGLVKVGSDFYYAKYDGHAVINATYLISRIFETADLTAQDKALVGKKVRFGEDGKMR